jgi:hypothetical protein
MQQSLLAAGSMTMGKPEHGDEVGQPPLGARLTRIDPRQIAMAVHRATYLATRGISAALVVGF